MCENCGCENLGKPIQYECECSENECSCGVIEFDEEPNLIKKKILSAFTGGRRNAEEQRKLGGQPEVCMVYKLMEFSFEDDDTVLSERYTRCITGKMLCGQCKKEVAEKVLNFVDNHNKTKKNMISLAKKLLSHKN